MSKMKDNVFKIVFLVKIKILRNGSPSTLEMKALLPPNKPVLVFSFLGDDWYSITNPPRRQTKAFG